jgi:PBSX family phage terminase large subunit
MTAPAIIAVFMPFPWQVAPWRDKSPVMLLTGSAGGGKSNVAAEKLHGFMLAYPGACGLALRKAREWCKGSVRMMLETVIGDDPRVHVQDDKVEYDNGSVIYFGGLKDKDQREALRSKRGKFGDPDIAWMEEANAFTRQDFDEVSGRLRGDRAGWTQLILTTNPDTPTHWIYNDLMQDKQASVYYSNAHDNPRNTQAYFDRLDAMVGVLRDRLRDGKWIRAEGSIYDEYDPAIHMIDADQCPEFVRRFRVVDFGYSNPFVCQWWGMDSDGRLYRYREIYQTHQLVEDVAPEIIRLSKGERIEFTLADHDAEDRATMEKHGVNTIPAVKDVSPGIQNVKTRLKVQPDGKPRLYFVRGALVDVDETLKTDGKPTCTEEEIPGYTWQKYADGKPDKEQPVKLNDHGCDTTRYIVHQLDGAYSAPLSKPQKTKSKFEPTQSGWASKY